MNIVYNIFSMENIHDAMVLLSIITLYLTKSNTRKVYVRSSLDFRGLILMLVEYIKSTCLQYFMHT